MAPYLLRKRQSLLHIDDYVGSVVSGTVKQGEKEDKVYERGKSLWSNRFGAMRPLQTSYKIGKFFHKPYRLNLKLRLVTKLIMVGTGNW